LTSTTTPSAASSETSVPRIVKPSDLTDEDMNRILDLDRYCKDAIHQKASANPHKYNPFPGAAEQGTCWGNGLPIPMQAACDFIYPELGTEAVTFDENSARSWRCKIS